MNENDSRILLNGLYMRIGAIERCLDDLREQDTSDELFARLGKVKEMIAETLEYFRQ